MFGGIAALLLFGVIETRTANPLFNLSLFKIRVYSLGNVANLMASLGRGGLQFILIIWLQGIWLPQHGCSYEETPLWAAIYMLPMTLGFLISAPLSGLLSDRRGAWFFATGGMIVTAATFFALTVLPVDFSYPVFAILLVVNGIGMGMFTAPNRAEVMSSLPGNARGVGAGMNATFQNAAMVLSIGVFFSLIIAGLSATLPDTLRTGLQAHGLPAAEAQQIGQLPPVGVLFAAFLGYNPIEHLLGGSLGRLPPDAANFLTGQSYFPSLVTQPFSDGLHVAFWFAIVASLVAAAASWFGRPRAKQADVVPPVLDGSIEATGARRSGS